MKPSNYGMAKIDITMLERLKMLNINVEHTQKDKVGLRELTRRMAKASTFPDLERELLKDAELKRRMRRR